MDKDFITLPLHHKMYHQKSICMFLRSYIWLLLLGIASITTTVKAQPYVSPIGAQVFIEPGQTDEEINTWFKLLSEHQMNCCRIRMFENYMKRPDGTWDFSLFDKAFKAAERYNVKIVGTLFPAAPDNSLGGFKHPYSQSHLQEIATYIKQVVTHFKTSPALYGWVLMNEPGTGGWVPNDAFANTQKNEWLKTLQPTAYNSKGYPQIVDFTPQQFLLHYNTWYLQWIANEVKKYDPNAYLHVNSHQIFSNIAEYNFPAWRNFLSSLGASAHPSWHYTMFHRNQYATALGANCAIISSGAGELPFWVTELQGGNNTYSGYKAFCPTKEEITQWLWTSIGNGAEHILFWCLNPRAVGDEAGEWALVDFQNQPTDRLTAASEVAKTLRKINSSKFKPVVANIHILYTRETLWVEKKAQLNDNTNNDYEGRNTGGAMKSAFAMYETLLENGINSQFQCFDEFNWNKPSYKGETIILSGQISLPSRYWEPLRNFVRNGGKLIMEGLSAFYDENMFALHHTGFPLQDVLGGALKEVKCLPTDFSVNYQNAPLPAHLWKGSIYNTQGQIVAQEGNSVLATKHRFVKGETFWFPSLLGLGTLRSGKGEALSHLLLAEVQAAVPFQFETYQKGVQMYTMQKGNQYLTILINKRPQATSVALRCPKGVNPSVVFADKGGSATANTARLSSEETLVILWK